MKRSLRRLVTLALPLAAGCSTVRPVPLSPTPIAIRGTTYVILRSGQTIEVQDARISTDSIFGTVGDGFPKYDARKSKPFAVALSGVERAESSEVNWWRTLRNGFLIWSLLVATVMSGGFGLW